MNGLKKTIDAKNQKIELANQHYSLVVCKKVLTELRLNIRADLSVREKQADQFYEKLLLKHSYFNGIKQFKQFLQIETAKAGRYYRFNIKMKLFKAWKVYKTNEVLKFESYEILIKEHNLFRLRAGYFKIWKEYPAEQKRLKDRQKRLDELRNKVKQLIPDYENPNSVSASNSISSLK